MTRLALLLLLAQPLCLSASPGSVRTLDGQSYEGDVRLGPDRIVVVNTNGGASTNIELRQLALLTLGPAAPLELNKGRTTNQSHGLRGSYFETTNLTGRSHVRIDSTLDFDWQTGSPVPGVGPDHFSARWEGRLQPAVTETFTFHLLADDGARFWLNQQLFIDQWTNQGPKETNRAINLEAGRIYPVRIEYREAGGSAQLRWLWSSPSTPRQAVPKERLFPPATSQAQGAANAPSTGLRGTYYNDTDLTGVFLTRFDPTIDFDWGQNAPFPGVNADRFSVRWTGEIVPQVPDLYTFYTVTDDGVRLWVDKKLVIDAWREEFLNLASLPMYLQAGQKYELRMETFESTGRAMAKLSWSSQSMPRTPLSANQLVPGPAPEPVTVTAGRRRLPVGIVMRNGSHIARPVESADETAIHLAGMPAAARVSTVNTARILLYQLTAEQLSRLQPGRPGLLLKNDDFVDGEFKGLAQGKVRLNSVLFGVKSYEADKVAAISLRDLRPASAQYEVKTRGESLFRANSIQLQQDALALRDADLAGFRIPADELMEIKNTAAPHSGRVSGP